MFIVFDLDGTLANIDHRLHHIHGGNRNYNAFFAACVDDLVVGPVLETLVTFWVEGHRVEIWSARSDQVRADTEAWLERAGLSARLLTHMRRAGDSTPDVDLKRSWLHELHPDERPDIVYDDRQAVVDMWRAEGVTCFQVNAWKEAGSMERVVPPICDPLLTIMVGPSGAGKSTWAEAHKSANGNWPDMILSSDRLRHQFAGSIGDQSRNEDVFLALHRIAKARLDSGLPTVIDATNLRKKDRLACVALASAGVGVRYVVVNRPMAEKQRDAGWRAGVMIGDKSLLETHEQRFQSQLKDILAGDGLPQVTVLDARTSEVQVAA